MPLLGASKEQQLVDNLGSADLVLDDAQLTRLTERSAPSLGFPHDFVRKDRVVVATYGDQWRSIDALAASHA